MPIYEYRCNACAAVDEVLQKTTDPVPEICPACGATRSLEKVVSHTSFQLKGGGWYKDLYASQAKPASGATSTDKPVAPSPIKETAQPAVPAASAPTTSSPASST